MKRKRERDGQRGERERGTVGGETNRERKQNLSLRLLSTIGVTKYCFFLKEVSDARAIRQRIIGKGQHKCCLRLPSNPTAVTNLPLKYYRYFFEFCRMF